MRPTARVAEAVIVDGICPLDAADLATCVDDYSRRAQADARYRAECIDVIERCHLGPSFMISQTVEEPAAVREPVHPEPTDQHPALRRQTARCYQRLIAACIKSHK